MQEMFVLAEKSKPTVDNFDFIIGHIYYEILLYIKTKNWNQRTNILSKYPLKSLAW